MFTRLVSVLVGLCVLLFSMKEARAERDLIVPFHESGHVVLDQLAGLRLSTSGFSYAAPVGIAVRSTKDTSTTDIWFAPSADVFVTDHLSVGGLVEIDHAWGHVESGGKKLDLPGTTSMTFLPRVGFYAPFSDRIGFWLRAGVGYASTQQVSFLTAGSAPTTTTFRAMVLDIDATVVYRFNETFFLKGGPEVGLTLGGREESSTAGVSSGRDQQVLQIGGSLGFGMNIEL
jgi:hypothetical protein